MFPLPNSWIAGIAIALCIVSFTAGWKVSSAFEAQAREKEMQRLEELRAEDAQKTSEKAQELENNLKQSRAYARRLERLVDYEVHNNDVYRDCIVPPDGVRLINDAAAGDTPAR